MWEHGCTGLFPILVCIVLLLAGFLVWRFLCRGIVCGTGTDNKSPSEESAENILKARYAKGEIGREEFERMKQEISGS